jgi:hypothetical protein
MATGAIAEHMYDVYTQMDMGLERAFYVFRGRGLYWSKPQEIIKSKDYHNSCEENDNCSN